jgi:hypothetical protein
VEQRALALAAIHAVTDPDAKGLGIHVDAHGAAQATTS